MRVSLARTGRSGRLLVLLTLRWLFQGREPESASLFRASDTELAKMGLFAANSKMVLERLFSTWDLSDIEVEYLAATNSSIESLNTNPNFPPGWRNTVRRLQIQSAPEMTKLAGFPFKGHHLRIMALVRRRNKKWQSLSDYLLKIPSYPSNNERIIAYHHDHRYINSQYITRNLIPCCSRGISSYSERHSAPRGAVVRDRKVVLVLNGYFQDEQIGLIFRNALAYGISGVILTGMNDPLCRKAARSSMGATLKVPYLTLSDLRGNKIIRTEDLFQELINQDFEAFQLTETPHMDLYLNQVNLTVNGKHSPEANGGTTSGENNFIRSQIVDKFAEEWSNDRTQKSVALFVNSNQSCSASVNNSHDAFLPFNIGVCLEELYEASLRSGAKLNNDDQGQLLAH